MRLFCGFFDKNLFLGDKRMKSQIRFFIIVILVCSANTGFAQQAAIAPDQPALAGDDNTADTLPFPYVAEVTGDNIYIRSGHGTNYYDCGKLIKGDRIEVVSSKFSWSRIVPPAGSFSWISTQYVSIDPNKPNVGVVTGDDVLVYAGSDTVKPLYSTTKQLKLNKGDTVTLLGEEKDNYYKIAPPSGAYLWVSTQYTKPLGPVGQVVITTTTTAPPAEPNETAVVVPTNLTVEAEKLKEYYALQKQVKAERAKAVDQQNYANIKKALTEIAKNKEAGKAARYSQFTIKQIECYELALAVAKEVQLQNEQLNKTKERIEKARATRFEEYQDLGRFSAVGQLQTFETYGPGHYRIIDDSGKTICYALPCDSASEMNLSKLVGMKVGLVGTIEPHQETESALVRFTDIARLK